MKNKLVLALGIVVIFSMAGMACDTGTGGGGGVPPDPNDPNNPDTGSGAYTLSIFAGEEFADDPLDRYADGTGTAAKFDTPHGLAMDGAGNVYVTDDMNNCVRKITPEGAVTTLAGSYGAFPIDGTGTEAKFNGLSCLAMDGAGNSYVGSYSRIRKVTSAGVVKTIVNISDFDLGGYPIWGIAVDSTGNIYFTVNGNPQCVYKLTPKQ